MIIKRDLLFTTSIYDSYNWFKICPPSWKERAYKAFVDSLSRVAWTPDKKIQRGLDFENLVYRIAKSKTNPEASPEFYSVVTEVVGGNIQKKIKKIETIDGQSFCLYGKTDAWFPDIIKDVKTTASFKEEKYRNSIQHPMYCYIENIPRFRYVVAVFNDDEDDKKIQSVEKIDIKFETIEEARAIVHARVADFWNFLNSDPELLKLYLEKFCLY